MAQPGWWCSIGTPIELPWPAQTEDLGDSRRARSSPLMRWPSSGQQLNAFSRSTLSTNSWSPLEPFDRGRDRPEDSQVVAGADGRWPARWPRRRRCHLLRSSASPISGIAARYRPPRKGWRTCTGDRARQRLPRLGDCLVRWARDPADDPGLPARRSAGAALSDTGRGPRTCTLRGPSSAVRPPSARVPLRHGVDVTSSAHADAGCCGVPGRGRGGIRGAARCRGPP